MNGNVSGLILQDAGKKTDPEWFDDDFIDAVDKVGTSLPGPKGFKKERPIPAGDQRGRIPAD